MSKARDEYYKYKESVEKGYCGGLISEITDYVTELEQHQETIDQLNEIYKHFGENPQRHKLVEECREYIGATRDADPNLDYRSLGRSEQELENNVISEIADVFIVSTQLVLNNPEIQKIVYQKIQRTLDRIKEGYYGKTNNDQN